MSRIRELTPEEAAHLRQQVQQRFVRNRSNGNGFRPSTFKGAYEDLRDDIIGNVPAIAFSVSLTRLRKFFYYTDPAICPVEQLERPSFGRDFIEALEQYVKQEVQPETPLKTSGARWKIALAVLFLAITGELAYLYFKPGIPKNWREDFNNTSVDSLQAHGFAWFDFDAASWSEQLKEGFLTLYTHRGDYWVKPHEERKIKNLMYKKISGDCFTIIAKIDDFDPQHNCQQFDIFLFDKHLSRETHLRAGFSYWKSLNENDPGVQYTTTNYQELGHVTQLGFFHVRNPANQGTRINTLWLKIHYENNEVSVYQKLNYEWNLWGQCIPPSRLNITPAYVGIAAFQGWTNDDHSPRSAPPVPALIDFIQVESCDE